MGEYGSVGIGSYSPPRTSAPAPPVQSITGLLDELTDILSSTRSRAYEARMRVMGPWPEEADKAKDQGADYLNRLLALIKLARDAHDNLRVVLEVL